MYILLQMTRGNAILFTFSDEHADLVFTLGCCKTKTQLCTWAVSGGGGVEKILKFLKTAYISQGSLTNEHGMWRYLCFHTVAHSGL